jgi:cellulose synthase/poly-beta-1,6-N-acetylglucosamine synthase-like glycosyltransferase
MLSSSFPFEVPAKFSHIRTRLRKHTLLFRYLAEINIILGAWYMQWRIFHSLNFNLLWLSVPLLIAEIYSYIGGVIFTIGLWRPLVRDVTSFNQMMPAIPESDYPTVDVFVTCYNEPVAIVEETTRAALALDYPTDKLRVYVLDDGNSSAMRSMAESLGKGCHYIARPKPPGKPHHAKAGNINYALFCGDTHGEFILTLDADHILKPQFLMRVLPYFYDYHPWQRQYESNKVAFVQTPQDFYNLPPGDPFGHSAHLFYGPIQQGKDGLNSAFYTGTDALLRREALVSVGLTHFSEAYAKDENRLDEFELIGGVSSTSITEDMNTAMRMHAAGWQSVYHHELLAMGLAPDDLNSMLGQRLRWAQGTLQVMLRENPIHKEGLSFWQKLQYFQTMYSYFSGFSTVIFIACPIIYFFTGLVPMSTDGYDFALHFIPVFLLNRLTFVVATWGIPAREVWRSEQYAIGLFPVFIQAVWSVFSKGSLNFKVTPKQRQTGIYLHLVVPQLTVFALTIAGLIWSLYRFATGQLSDPLIHEINALWAIYNLALLFAIVRSGNPKRALNLSSS